MYKLRRKKFHPEVGVAPKGWLFGVGYDFNREWSVDVFMRKDWNLKGKPEAGVGISRRF